MKLPLVFRAATVGLGLLALPSAVEASAVKPAVADARTKSADTGQPALAPFAHVLFCKRYPGECMPSGRPEEVLALDAPALATLKRVNAAVNRAIRPKSDAPGPLGDVWRIAPSAGDCDDFAVTKRHRLVALGFPASALRLAVTRTRGGDGHAVVVVRTNRGDLVLDNRTDRMTSWSKAGLSLEKLQSGTDPQRWFSASTLAAFNE